MADSKNVRDVSLLCQELGALLGLTAAEVTRRVTTPTASPEAPRAPEHPYFDQDGYVVDPVSTLKFPPTPRCKWLDRHNATGDDAELAKLKAIEFCLETFATHRAAGLLYSGHILKADKTLYDRVALVAYRSDQYPGVTELFRRNGILVPEDLQPSSSPSSPIAREKIETIRYVNALLINHKVVNEHSRRFRINSPAL